MGGPFPRPLPRLPLLLLLCVCFRAAPPPLVGCRCADLTSQLSNREADLGSRILQLEAEVLRRSQEAEALEERLAATEDRDRVLQVRRAACFL